MFNEQNYLACVGALECTHQNHHHSEYANLTLMFCALDDPEVSPHLEHRKYLQSSVIFKEVVPIQNADLLKKIHLTFRIQYLKDVILPRLIDDLTFATLNSLIYFNNVDIVEHLYKDTAFLTELYDCPFHHTLFPSLPSLPFSVVGSFRLNIPSPINGTFFLFVCSISKTDLRSSRQPQRRN